MRFFSIPHPTDVPGWWVSGESLMTDRFRPYPCDHKVPTPKGGKRKCRGAAARFYEAEENGRPKEGGKAYCLVHFQKNVPSPTPKEKE